MKLPTKCHFIGIGGIGMSALARLMIRKQIATSGSDAHSSTYLDQLQSLGASVHVGHNPDLIDSDMTIVYSSDIAESNAELKRARELGCTVLHRSELLQHYMATRKGLAVAGTHGKTTTSALLSVLLEEAGLHPGAMVGGIIKNFGSNAIEGDGPFFVTEADESDGTFLRYFPSGAILTNIDSDHLAHYGTEKELIAAFKQFAGQVRDHLVWCADDPKLCALGLKGVSYGFSEGADFRILKGEQRGWGSHFSLSFQGKVYGEFFLPLIGKHNIRNGAAVAGLALLIGLTTEQIQKGLAAFQGVKRRADFKGQVGGVTVLDDYAHHPTEVKTTLEGIRNWARERRVIAVFEPHRYSRLKYCTEEFEGAFQAADLLVVTDVHSAGEQGDNEKAVAALMAKLRSHKSALYVPRSQLLAHMEALIRPHDVVVTMGAGSITSFGGELLPLRPKKWTVAVVCGGESPEHDISLISADHVKRSLNPDLYEVKVFTLSKKGLWEGTGRIPPQDLSECEIIFPVLHGPMGEDGTIQGMFEMLGIAYVGCSHTASAIAMDKDFTKRLCLLSGIRTSPYVPLTLSDWKRDRDGVLHSLKGKLRFPVFVKAVHLGSSIGVEKVETEERLPEAIESVFRVDHKLIVEEGVRGREIEFAVLGNEWVDVFPPGEVLTNGKFYDYEAKYSHQGMKTTIAPELSKEALEKGMELAKEAFRAIGGEGMARVDFFYDETGRYWLNEINPIPGFTPISLYPQICAAQGITSSQLVDRLLVLALHRKQRGGVLAHGLPR